MNDKPTLEQIQQLLDMGSVVGLLANIEAATLDIASLLKHLPRAPASVGDELQQIADLSKQVAAKLELTEMVEGVRNFQEESVKARRERAQASDKLFEVAQSLVDRVRGEDQAI